MVGPMRAIHDPFAGRPVREVPLGKAPLERVVAQIRYPVVLAVEQGESVAPFQTAIEQRYPILQEERVHLLAAAPPQMPPQVVWRFSDEAAQWRVSLSRAFIALETVAYTSRSDFVARFHEVLVALVQHVGPTRLDRLGVRYIDRIRGAAMKDLASLVRDEMRGIASSSVSDRCVHSLTESVFEIDDARLLARWGLLPPDKTIDTTLDPVSERTWVLDLDMATTTQRPFDLDKTMEMTRRFAEQIYSFFRWAVTPEFLKRFGGEA
jgi:uncharacterized protein (TIGR04255 family)